MKRIVAYVAIVVIIVASIGAVYIAGNVLSGSKNQEFYVGVTYCGNSADDAKLLVDKVKDYTNLFVVQSGPLMTDSATVNEIGDYAVAKGLHFSVFFDTSQVPEQAQWLSNASQRWGGMFGGIYYADEPGGKLLDTQLTFVSPEGNTITKDPDGTIQTINGSDNMRFHPDGTITVDRTNSSDLQSGVSLILFSTVTYYPNGSVTVGDQLMKALDISMPVIQVISHNFYTAQNGTDRIAQEPTYQQMQNRNPVPSYTAAADLFINKTGTPLDRFSNYWNLSSRSFPIFTSDYALYWWDYKAGYDMTLAQLGWNNSVNQEIGLVRGAANLQGKDWGTMITWKYTQAPYLCSGDEMYQQLKTSYEAGAKYVLIFNYAKDMSGPYGTLQEEHFEALQRFWTEEVQKSSATHGSVKGEVAFVLPANYGWGMRHPQDIIWGIWQPDERSSQIWSNLQAALNKYGGRLDIVYEDHAYPTTGKYANIIYWNQTG